MKHAHGNPHDDHRGKRTKWDTQQEDNGQDRAGQSQGLVVAGDPYKTHGQVATKVPCSLQELAASMRHSDRRNGFRSIACLNANLELYLDSADGDSLVVDILVGQLQIEKDALLAQHIVKVLTSVLLIFCKDMDNNKDASQDFSTGSEVTCRLRSDSLLGNAGQRTYISKDCWRQRRLELAHSLMRNFINYFTTEHQKPDCLRKTSFKLQILRSLCLIAEKMEIADLEALQGKCVEFFADGKVRLKTQVLRLLVITVKERQRCGTAVSEENISGADSKSSFLKDGNAGDLVLKVAQEYTRDPQVCVRRAALDAILTIHRERYTMTRDCYKNACALLQDSCHHVRVLAIQVVQLWVEVVEKGVEENSVTHDVNDAFLKICSMLTDMDMKVRIQACSALGSMRRLSEDVLLQTLRKKPSNTLKEKDMKVPSSIIAAGENKDVIDRDDEEIQTLLRSNTGAFVQCIEDEFSEVRQAAIEALTKLSGCKRQMQISMFELLIDMLHDDCKDVRMKILHSLLNMACKDGLLVHEKHLYMLHGVLEDSNPDIRSTGRKLLAEIKLLSVNGFRKTIHALMNDLDRHGEDNDISQALYCLGSSNSSYVQCAAADFLQEIKAILNCETGLDEPRCRAYLTVFVAAAKSDPSIISLVPGRLLSLSRMITSKLPPGACTLQVEHLGPKTYAYKWTCKSSEYPYDTHLFEGREGPLWMLPSSELQEAEQSNVHKKAAIPNSCLYGREMFQNLIKNVVKSIHRVKSLLEVGKFSAAHNILSGCRMGLKGLVGKVESNKPLILFTLLYVDCLSLILEGRAYFKSSKKNSGMHSWNYFHELSLKLESVIRYMKHAFIGYSDEHLYTLNEICLVPCIWRISTSDDSHIWPCYAQLKSILASVSMLDKHRSSFTPFIQEVKDMLLAKMDNCELVHVREAACKIASCYWPEIIPTVSSVVELCAEVIVPGSDFEHPVSYLPGLPLGLTISIYLYKVSTDCKVWLWTNLGTCEPQYTFLNHGDIKSQNRQDITTTLQIQRMPNVTKCVLTIAIMLECPADTLLRECAGRGPVGHVVPLSRKKEIHLVSKFQTDFKNTNK